MARPTSRLGLCLHSMGAHWLLVVVDHEYCSKRGEGVWWQAAECWYRKNHNRLKNRLGSLCLGLLLRLVVVECQIVRN